MNKEEAAAKVAKLRRLAERNNSPSESNSATQEAERLIKKHGLTESDLSAGSKSAAFDELLSELDAHVKTQQVPTIVSEVIGRMKSETGKNDKAKALDKFVMGIRTVSWLVDVRKIKSVVDRVLKKHGITI